MADLVKMICNKLHMNDAALFRKASEFERLARLKMSATGGNISNSALPVICADLAADVLALPFDFESALRIAAVKKSVYVKNKRMLEKLLNIKISQSAAGLCVQLGCPNATDTAERLFKKFQGTDIKHIDDTHPQYLCMAIYHACKIEKIKVSKAKFLSHSRLKLSQWNELDAQWRDLVNEFASEKKKRPQKKNKAGEIVELAEKENRDEEIHTELEHPKEQYEDYEVWKERILAEAYEELKKTKVIADLSELKVYSREDVKSDGIKIDMTNGILLNIK